MYQFEESTITSPRERGFTWLNETKGVNSSNDRSVLCAFSEMSTYPPVDGDINLFNSLFQQLSDPIKFKEAEEKLNIFQQDINHFRHLLMYCTLPNVDSSLRFLATLTFKNTIEKISNDQHSLIQDLFLHQIATAEANIRTHLVCAFAVLAMKKPIFKNYIDRMNEFASSHDLNLKSVIFQITSELAKQSSNKAKAKKTILHLKTFFLNHAPCANCQEFLSKPSLEAYLVVKNILKSYKYMRQSCSIFESRKFIPQQILEILIVCLQIPVTEEVLNGYQNISKHPIMKLKKVASQLLSTLVLRLRTESDGISKKTEKNAKIRMKWTTFLKSLPSICDHVLPVITDAVSKPHLYSGKLISLYLLMLKFLHIIDEQNEKTMRNSSKQILDTILFPNLVICDDHMSTLEDSPITFIRGIMFSILHYEYPSQIAGSILRQFLNDSQSVTHILAYSLKLLQECSHMLSSLPAGNDHLDNTPERKNFRYNCEITFGILCAAIKSPLVKKHLNKSNILDIIQHTLRLLESTTSILSVHCLIMKFLSRLLSLPKLEVTWIEQIASATLQLLFHHSNANMKAIALISLFRQLSRMPQIFIIFRDQLQKIVEVILMVSRELQDYEYFNIIKFLTKKYPSFIDTVVVYTVNKMLEDFLYVCDQYGSDQTNLSQEQIESKNDVCASLLDHLNLLLEQLMSDKLIVQVQGIISQFMTRYLSKYWIDDCIGELCSLCILIIDGSTPPTIWNFIQRVSLNQEIFTPKSVLCNIAFSDFITLLVALIASNPEILVSNLSLLQLTLSICNKIESKLPKETAYSVKIYEVLFTYVARLDVNIHHNLCCALLPKLDYIFSLHEFLPYDWILSAVISQPTSVVSAVLSLTTHGQHFKNSSQLYATSQNQEYQILVKHFIHIVQKLCANFDSDCLSVHTLQLLILAVCFAIRQLCEIDFNLCFEIFPQSIAVILLKFADKVSRGEVEEESEQENDGSHNNDWDDDENYHDDSDCFDMDDVPCALESSGDDGNEDEASLGITCSKEIDIVKSHHLISPGCYAIDYPNDTFNRFISELENGNSNIAAGHGSEDHQQYQMVDADGDNVSPSALCSNNDETDEIDDDDADTDLPTSKNLHLVLLDNINLEVLGILKKPDVPEALAELFCLFSTMLSLNHPLLEFYKKQTISPVYDSMFKDVMSTCEHKYKRSQSESFLKIGGYKFIPPDANNPLPKEFIFS